jgi:hypothetical protein
MRVAKARRPPPPKLSSTQNLLAAVGAPRKRAASPTQRLVTKGIIGGDLLGFPVIAVGQFP